MSTLKKILLPFTLVLSLFGFAANALAGTPVTGEDGVTRIHLEEHGGHFTAEETLAGLKAGEYEFVVTNKAGKLVGFQIQSLADTSKNLDMFPLEPGETRISRVTVGKQGVRFRCPINPTPWYDLDVIR